MSIFVDCQATISLQIKQNIVVIDIPINIQSTIFITRDENFKMYQIPSLIVLKLDFNDLFKLFHSFFKCFVQCI